MRWIGWIIRLHDFTKQISALRLANWRPCRKLLSHYRHSDAALMRITAVFEDKNPLPCPEGHAPMMDGDDFGRMDLHGDTNWFRVLSVAALMNRILVDDIFSTPSKRP
jgi:hypothetical protein